MIDDGRRRDVDGEDYSESHDIGDASKNDTGQSEVIKHDVGESGDTESGRPQAKEGDDD